MNLNTLARYITLDEGLKVSLPIGQVKEVMAILFRRLAALSPEEVEAVLKRYRKTGKK